MILFPNLRLIYLIVSSVKASLQVKLQGLIRWLPWSTRTDWDFSRAPIGWQKPAEGQDQSREEGVAIPPGIGA